MRVASPFLKLAALILLFVVAAEGQCQTSQATNALSSFTTINVESNPHPALDAGLVVTAACFSAHELDQMVRRHIRRVNPRFEFGAATAHVLIPQSSNYLAAVWYSPGRGKPALLCTLDFSGRVVNARVGEAERDGGDLPALAVGIREATPELGSTELAEKLWTPERINSVVRAFVAKSRIGFDFSRVRFSGMSIPKDRGHLATVFYRHEFYKQSLSCKLGWGGEILESHVGTAIP